MKNWLWIFILLGMPIFTTAVSGQSASKQNVQYVLSEEGKRHWQNAKVYMEEVRIFSDNMLAITELEELLKKEEYPEVYLELGKLYGKGIQGYGRIV